VVPVKRIALSALTTTLMMVSALALLQYDIRHYRNVQLSNSIDMFGDRNRKHVAAVGKPLAAKDVPYGSSNKTLILVLDVRCRYCTSSIPFYRTLAQVANREPRVQVVAVFSSSLAESGEYLTQHELAVSRLQKSLESLGVLGTPTLIMVGRSGMIEHIWVGKLSPTQEREVLANLQPKGV
jgi:hypothetical protein